jgi:pimeloyl-ACP methyl ester carboxylesterase
MKHNVYLFPGLGADERIFKHLNFPQCQIHYVKWPKITKETSSASFLSDLKTQIKTTKNNVLLGVSFGGLVAQDLAAMLPVEKLILVSSVIDAAEIPRIYRSTLSALLLQMTPNFLLTRPNSLINFLFSVTTDDGRKTLGDIIRDTDPNFLRWAVAYLQKWQRPAATQAKQVYRIHGVNDRIFPKTGPEVQTAVVPGGHFAVYESSADINALLKSWLGSSEKSITEVSEKT